MDAQEWFDLCYRSLGIPEEAPDKRLLAARHLVEATGGPVDVLGIGAAETAIDLVVRHGESGRLDEVLLGLDYEPLFLNDDAGQARAMECAKVLLAAIVEYVERTPTE